MSKEIKEDLKLSSFHLHSESIIVTMDKWMEIKKNHMIKNMQYFSRGRKKSFFIFSNDIVETMFESGLTILLLTDFRLD